jgi:nitrogen fixation protein NifT
MKVMLRTNDAGTLFVYVPKKDLEEEVVKQTIREQCQIFTLANGWELEFTNLPEPLKLPLTFEAKKLN